MISKGEGALLEEALTHSVIRAFYDVHRGLGFGFREYLYALALERELVARGHRVDREVGVMVYYRQGPLAWQTLDMIVDEKLVLETKGDGAPPASRGAATVQLPVRDAPRSGAPVAFRS